MAVELGAAYISILPETKGLAKGITGELQGSAVASGAKKSGSSMGGLVATGLKRTVKAGLAGGALFAGIAAKKGLDRLMGIEDARASLLGLGNSTKTVDKIMQNALNSVKGTAFGMADAAQVSASAVAAGVKPGKELEANLRLVADAATIGKTSLGEMGAIFNKVAASNKIQGDTIAQLNDKGIPIIQLLAKELGVSADEVTALASKGKIDFKTFSQAMQAGLGGAALKSGDTTRGAFNNMMASIGRIGANFLSGIFPQFKNGFQGITAALAPMEEKAKVWGAALSSAFSQVVAAAGPIASQVVAGVKALAPAFAAVASAGLRVVGFFAQHKTLTLALVAAVTALVAVTKVHAAVMAVQAAGGLAAFIAKLPVVAALTRTWTAVQWAMNAALTANPIGLVIAAIAALVVGIVIAYKKSDTFRSIVQKAFTGIKAAAAAVFPYIRTIVRVVFAAVAAYARTYWKVVSTVVKVAIGAVRGAVNGMRAIVGIISSAWNAARAAVSNAIGKIVALARGIKGRVTGALAGAANWLRNAGIQIIQGLLNGIESMIGKVRSKLQSLTNMIPDWKGPADKDKKLLRPAGRMLMDGLVRGINDGASSVKANLTRLTSELKRTIDDSAVLKKARAGASKATRARIAAYNEDVKREIAAQKKAVDRYARSLDLWAKRVDMQVSKLRSMRKAAADLKASTAESIRGELDLGSLVSDEPGAKAPTFQQVSAQVSQLAARARVFASKIRAMAKKGIPAGLIQEVAGLGSVKGIAVANALLAGSRQQVAKLRADYGAISSSANAVGQSLADALYGPGIRAQEGLIKGLLAGKGLSNAARQLARKLTKSVKKELGIRSPSRVFRDEVGAMLPAGVVKGVESGQGAVDRAVASMVQTPTPGLSARVFGAGVAASAPASTARPIYADGIGLVGYLRELANGEARIEISKYDNRQAQGVLLG